MTQATNLAALGSYITVNSSGQIGVGTASPSEALDVNGALVVRGQTQSNKTSQATVDFGTGTGGIRYLSWGASGTNGTHSWWQGQGNAGATQTLTLNAAGSLIGTVGYFAGPTGASVGTYGISTPDTNYSLTLQRVVGSSGNLKLTGDDSVAGNPNLLLYNTRTSSGSGISYDSSNFSTNVNLSSGTRSWINNGITSVQFTVANNTAQVIASYNGYGTPLIQLPSAAGNVMMAITVRNGVSGVNGNFWFGYVVLHVAGSSAPVSFNNYAQSGSWASTTGVLSGTTGSSGNITLSTYTNSGSSQYAIYIENRFGQAMNFCVTFIGLTQ